MGNRSNCEVIGVFSGIVLLMEIGGLNWFVGMNFFLFYEVCRFFCYV